MLTEYLKRQSMSANWTFQDQLCNDDQNPLWTSIPGDLVVTFSLVDRRGCPAGVIGASNDGSGKVAFDTNGIVNVNFPPASFGGITADLYDVHVKIATSDTTIEKVYGRLPLSEGI